VKGKIVLGRGLDALIKPGAKESVESHITLPSAEIKEDDGHSIDVLAKLPVNSIQTNPYQPRTEFDREALDDLKKSILENGLIQPITVRRNGDGIYELISGERRLRACREVGFKDIPAYIIKADTKEQMIALALIENIQRENLNAIEVAHAYKKLMEECALSQEEIAEKVGKDRSTITNSVRLLKLPEDIQKSLIKNEITMGHARALINVPSEKVQLFLLEKIRKQNLSVRKVEEMVKNILSPNKGGKDKAKHTTGTTLEELSNRDLEDRLRNILATKVSCRQNKNGSGEIVIEFYSKEELERLYELFELITKTYN
jgi:ParB family chromosome partitioning protein